jgi:hypothetical protein
VTQDRSSKARALGLALGLGLAICGPALADSITFDAMPPDAPPGGFVSALTGGGGPPRWVIRPAPSGEVGRIVAQESAERIHDRFPLLVRPDVRATDLDLSVRFRPVSGTIDQAAGLVWRYSDARNYYLVRANALEDNVVLYKVENGRRIDLPLVGKGQTYGAQAPVSKSGWSTLAVSVRADRFTVELNGVRLFEVEDRTFTGPVR